MGHYFLKANRKSKINHKMEEVERKKEDFTMACIKITSKNQYLRITIPAQPSAMLLKLLVIFFL